MKSCLIGYTGFVGGNIAEQGTFDDLYNSSNINDIQGKEYSVIYCAGVSAVKWKANKDPEQDLCGINKLLTPLKNVKAHKFVLISTVDVYKTPLDVNEDTIINPEELQPYGKHRYYVEDFVRQNFENHHIIRLPGLFGNGLKKNIIYDFLNNNCIDMIDSRGVFQFYNLDRIYSDIQVVIKNNLELANFATAPTSVREVIKCGFDIDFTQELNKDPAIYDMQTKYANLFGADIPYIMSKKQVLDGIKGYVDRQKDICCK